MLGSVALRKATCGLPLWDASDDFGVLDRGGERLVLGIVLVAAGLYQFTPLKRVCLHHCRSPLAFVALYWRDGPLGRCAWGSCTAPFALAAAGRCSPFWSWRG